MPIPLPGTDQHQAMLQFIVDYYGRDPHILAVLLFGSLGRGNWDAYSDLDLDIVTADDVTTDARVELARLCHAIKQENGLEAIIVADDEEGDVVLSNLLEFSIRYHRLNDTKPAILESLVVLAGSLSAEEIQAAAGANRIEQSPDLTTLINQCIRYTLEIHNAIARKRLWMSIELLHRIRNMLMEVFTITRGGVRGLQYFETEASPYLHERLQQIQPTNQLSSVKAALDEVLHILSDDLEAFSDGKYQLEESQRTVLEHIKNHVLNQPQ